MKYNKDKESKFISQGGSLKLLRLTNDIVFKMFFGEDSTQELLPHFLNSVLEFPEGALAEVTLLNPTLPKGKVKERDLVVDVRLRTNTGDYMHVEMQAKGHTFFNERVACYNARIFSSQLKKGSKYEKLKKSISIVIMDFILEKGCEDYHHVYMYRNRKGKIFTDAQVIHTLELPKLSKEPKNNKEIWMKLFAATEKEELEMIAKQSTVFKKAVNRLKELSANASERAQVRADMRIDAISLRKTLESQAKREGLEQGIEQGIEQAAIRAIENEYPAEEVVKITGLTLERVRELTIGNEFNKN